MHVMQHTWEKQEVVCNVPQAEQIGGLCSDLTRQLKG